MRARVDSARREKPRVAAMYPCARLRQFRAAKKGPTKETRFKGVTNPAALSLLYRRGGQNVILAMLYSIPQEIWGATPWAKQRLWQQHNM